jgi:spore coat protein U-like protein
VVTNCQIVVSDLAFGTYDPLGANQNQQLDGSAAVRVLCTRSASASIEIDAGQSGSAASRSMTSGSQRVAYQLYRDSNRTRAWSGESDAIRFVSSSGRDSQQFTVYARIPAGQQVPSGLYTDVVRATVYF